MTTLRAKIGAGFVAGALMSTGFTVLAPVTASAGSSTFISIAAGEDYGLALNADGTVLSWGDNSNGQLGNGTTSPYVTTPTIVPGLSSVVAISTGFWTSLALKSDGTVWAWGYNPDGELGTGSLSTSGCYCIPTPTQVPGLAGVRAVAAGGDFMGALKTDGTVWEWGSNAYGELGTGSPTLSPNCCVATASQVPGVTGVAALALGYDHTLAVRSDGSVWSWGYNYDGELGNGSFSTTGCTCVAVPAPVPGMTAAIAAASALSSSLVVKSDGTVWTWGLGNDGLLGTGSMISTPTPAQVPGLASVSGASGNVNGFTYLAVLSNGSVVGWGYGGDGELFNNTKTPVFNPTPIAASALPPGTTTAVASGDGWSLALESDGTVWSAGWNKYGQLGQGFVTPSDGSCTCVPTTARSLVSTGGQTASIGLRNVNTTGDPYFDNTFTPGQSQQLKVVVTGSLAAAYFYVDGVQQQSVLSGGTITWTPPNNPDGTPLFTSHTLVVRGSDPAGNPVTSQTLALYALVEVEGDAVSILPNGAVLFNPFSFDPFSAVCLDKLPSTPVCAGQPPPGPSLYRMLNGLTMLGKSNGTSFIEAPKVVRNTTPGHSFYCDDQPQTAAQRTNSLSGPFTDGSFTSYISTLETRVNVTTPEVFRVPTPPGTTGPTNQSDFVPWIFSSMYVGISPNGTTTVQWADTTSHPTSGNSLFPYHYLYKDALLLSPKPHPTPDLVAWTRTAVASPQTIIDALYLSMNPVIAQILQQLLKATAPDIYIAQHLFAADRAECARQRFAKIYQNATPNLEDYLQNHFPGMPLWYPFALTLNQNLQPHFNFHEFVQGVAQLGFVRDAACVVPGCPGKEHMKVIGIFSPVSVDVYDSSGHHSGPLPDGTIEQGIDSVTYLTVGHGTFLVIPNDPSYRVQLTGTGSGTFTLDATDFNGQSKLEFEQYHNVPVTASSMGTLTMGAVGTPVSWDLSGTGHPVQLSPSTLTTNPASDSTDVTAPTTTVSLQGTAGQPGYYRSPVDVTFVGHDDLSGVGRTDYTTDGGTTWTPYTIAPLHFGADGTYQLLFRSIDYAGNQEQAKTVTFVIDTVPPTTTAAASPQPPPPGYPTVTLQIKSAVITPGGALPPTTCWVTRGVNVLLSAADNTAGAGVQEIDYTLSGAQNGSGTLSPAGGTVAITAGGNTTLTYFSVDRAGNRDGPHVITVFMAPNIPLACVPAPGVPVTIPQHGTLSVSGTLTVNGYAIPFSKTFSF